VRILLDTNVWLAVLATDGQCRRIWRNARHTSIISVSPEILAEIDEKLRTKFGFSPRHARLLSAFVRRQTVPVQITGSPPRFAAIRTTILFWQRRQVPHAHIWSRATTTC
jgi:predicted nucleic acid-binding protein